MNVKEAKNRVRLMLGNLDWAKEKGYILYPSKIEKQAIEILLEQVSSNDSE